MFLQERAAAGMRQAFVQTLQAVQATARSHTTRWRRIKLALEQFHKDPRRFDNLSKRLNAFLNESFQNIGQV